MKVHLMFCDRDFDAKAPLPQNSAALVQDLELHTLFGAMTEQNKVLGEVVPRAMLASLTEPEAIAYRQAVLADCLAHPALAREIFAIADEAIQTERREWSLLSSSPQLVLHRSLRVLEGLVASLRRLRALAVAHAAEVHSDGLVHLFVMLREEMSDGYFAELDRCLEQLRFRDGMLLRASLGRGAKGVDYSIRTPRRAKASWLRKFLPNRIPPNTLVIADRDENGHRCLSELVDRGVDPVANTLAQSVDHVLSFFAALQDEVGFYVGCLNLHDRLVEKGQAFAIPTAQGLRPARLTARGLYDPCLALRLPTRPVANDLNADGKRLVIVTGANQGGKTTLVRSLGVAQLMMQSGMFVAAANFSASVCAGVFTHFTREEDASMQHGKLEEELSRMGAIASQLRAGSLLLCNESFASTNEREGSEIARQVTRAVTDAGIRVVFVTFLYDFAQRLAREGAPEVLFLRAERLADGTRTFRVVEAEPLPTSFGEDVYREIFGADARPSAGPVPRVPPAVAGGR